MIDKARDFLFRRRTDYIQTFKGPVAERVLKDLAIFCRANESTYATDPRDAAKLDGRREVWLRIQDHLRLPPETLYRFYNPEE